MPTAAATAGIWSPGPRDFRVKSRGMFRRVFIANRGEVAARIARTCQSLGIATRAAATTVDRDLSYLSMCDEVADIGGPRAYLDADAMLAAAEGCSALHPGWGFLAENATFAARCQASRITFVGPSSAVMRQMADKVVARSTMARLGVSPIPGSVGVVADVAAARTVADEVGYPVLLKAVAGGGGRGMRRVHQPNELASAFAQATAEAASAFGNAALYLEKLVENGRHIELQVLSDGRHAIHLGERECSVQRRHQKLIEESPSPGVTREQVDQVGKAVVSACEALGYTGAGTIEMLLDSSGHLYFMEMNTRLQVEHTVTEERCGVDLVAEQFKIAAHQPLALRPQFSGHAIQCRINAEDPSKGFQPTPGDLHKLVLPKGEGVRVDTHLSQGDRVPPQYDSMIGKVICHAPTRAEAIARMTRALKEMQVQGVATTIPAHLEILKHPDFVSGNYNTSILEGAS